MEATELFRFRQARESRARSRATSVCQMFDQNVCRFLWQGGSKIKCDVLIANIRNALRVSTPLLTEAIVVEIQLRVPSIVPTDATVNIAIVINHRGVCAEHIF